MNGRFCSQVLAATLIGSLGSIALDGRQQATFRAGVDAVRIDALVTAGGKPVTGLTVADFEVEDNGVAQAVSLAEPNARFNLILALDTSATVKARRFGICCRLCRRPFSRSSRESRSPFSPTTSTSRSARHSRRISRPFVAVWIRSIRRASPPCTTPSSPDCPSGVPRFARCSCLFTDGQDNASWLSASQVIESARRADVVVCPVVVGMGVPDPSRPCACRSTAVVVAGDGRARRADGRASLQSRSGEHDARGVPERADGVQVALPDCLHADRRAE